MYTSETPETFQKCPLIYIYLITHSYYRFVYLKRIQGSRCNNNELTEVDEKPSIALSLIMGHRHDTRHVILLLTRFFL